MTRKETIILVPEMCYFEIGDILSITSKYLVSRRGMMGVTDILNYMTGDYLYNIQLPRAADVCRPELLLQHPELKEVNEYLSFVRRNRRLAYVERWGKTHEMVKLPVSRLPPAKWQPRDIIEEVREKASHAEIVGVTGEETAEQLNSRILTSIRNIQEQESRS